MSLIELKVSRHPNGRYSVSKTIDGKMSPTVPRKLAANKDKVEFDRRLKKYVEELEDKGHTVIVDDLAN